MLKGIDISNWQGDVDFAKIKTARDFFIMKVTEGRDFIDRKFQRNKAGARKAGLLVGYYCFSRPDLGNTVEQEVDFLLKTIGDIKDGEIIFLDYEVNYPKPVEWCKKWLDYLSQKLNGYKGLVYLNQSLLNNYNWKPLIDSDYGLWLAYYDYDSEYLPKTKWGTLAFKQYSNRGTVPGVSGAVDDNTFFGFANAFMSYGFKNTPTSVITPEQYKVLLDENKSLTVQIQALQSKLDVASARVVDLEKYIQINTTPLNAKKKDGAYIYDKNELISELIRRWTGGDK